jgi:hypothetical protein
LFLFVYIDNEGGTRLKDTYQADPLACRLQTASHQSAAIVSKDRQLDRSPTHPF